MAEILTQHQHLLLVKLEILESYFCFVLRDYCSEILVSLGKENYQNGQLVYSYFEKGSRTMTNIVQKEGEQVFLLLSRAIGAFEP